MTNQQIKNCVDACIACAITCTHCAISCLEEKEVQKLTKCIRLDLECAAICKAAAELIREGSAYAKELCQLCATICIACAEECDKHADMGMEHCRECADACRSCAKETMEIYHKLETHSQNTKDQHWSVSQDECAIVSRVASELISLRSAYATQISKINASVCNAASNDLRDHAAIEMQHIDECNSVAKKAHQELTDNDNPDEKDKSNLSKDELHKINNTHSSALLGASVWRSPTAHARSHVDLDVRGRRSRITNTGPFFTI